MENAASVLGWEFENGKITVEKSLHFIRHYAGDQFVMKTLNTPLNLCCCQKKCQGVVKGSAALQIDTLP